MEFAPRGPATAAADGDVIGDGRRCPDFPPPHGDSMLVIRDALQAQLKKDRLHQQIIEAELSRIDRAITLRSATTRNGMSAAGGERAKPASYSFSEKSNMTIWPKSPSSTWELAGITTPVKIPKTPQKWICTVCQVEATSERNIQDHFAGQKHQWNVATLESRNNGTRDQAIAQAILGQSKSLTGNYVQQPSSELSKLPSKGSTSDILSSEMARHKMLLYFCKICNVQCSNESMFAGHRSGKKHRGNVWKLKLMTFCKVCNLQCNSEQMLADHLTGKKHQKNASLMGEDLKQNQLA